MTITIPINMSDSDSDYCDVGADFNEMEADESDNADTVPRARNAGKKGRGKDIDWIPIQTFQNVDEYNDSDISIKLKKEFTLQRARDPDYADTETYICKFARKVGYIPCTLKYKIEFLSSLKFLTMIWRHILPIIM